MPSLPALVVARVEEWNAIYIFSKTLFCRDN